MVYGFGWQNSQRMPCQFFNNFILHCIGISSKGEERRPKLLMYIEKLLASHKIFGTKAKLKWYQNRVHETLITSRETGDLNLRRENHFHGIWEEDFYWMASQTLCADMLSLF